MIDVSRDHRVFGDDANGVSTVGQYFETTAGNAKHAFDGLIRVGDAAHSNRLRFVTALLEFAEQELRCVFFNKDAGFEVEARRHAEVFVSRSRVAVNATVFAAAVRV